MTINTKTLNPLPLLAGKIRQELVGIETPQAALILRSVEGLPDDRWVVVDLYAYNEARLKDKDYDEDFPGQSGEGVEPLS